jgi:hypothetical protein
MDRASVIKMACKLSMATKTSTCKSSVSVAAAVFETDLTSNERSPHLSGAAHPSRCVSVPFATVSTYTHRLHLSEELGKKLEKSHGGNGLAHATAVIGLGGTGKTQLVLCYIEEHEEEYDIVLWIDAQSEETTRSSYERCRRALGLPVEVLASDGTLQDVVLKREDGWRSSTAQMIFRGT